MMALCIARATSASVLMLLRPIGLGCGEFFFMALLLIIGFSSCPGVEDPHSHPPVSALLELNLDVLGMAAEGDPARRRLHETGPAALIARCQERTVRSVRATYELISFLVVRYLIPVSFPRFGLLSGNL